MIFLKIFKSVNHTVSVKKNVFSSLINSHFSSVCLKWGQYYSRYVLDLFWRSLKSKKNNLYRLRLFCE